MRRPKNQICYNRHIFFTLASTLGSAGKAFCHLEGLSSVGLYSPSSNVPSSYKVLAITRRNLSPAVQETINIRSEVQNAKAKSLWIRPSRFTPQWKNVQIRYVKVPNNIWGRSECRTWKEMCMNDQNRDVSWGKHLKKYWKTNPGMYGTLHNTYLLSYEHVRFDQGFLNMTWHALLSQVSSISYYVY